MNQRTTITPTSWLAFELNILRRMEFHSAAIPFAGNPILGTYLKRRSIRVLANDLLQSSWTKALATVQNNSEKLSDDDVNALLEDVYVPKHRLNNQALRDWFGETDAWWFDNARQNLDKLHSPFAFAIGASLVMAVGDYALSFNDETRELRQPLSNVYRRLWMSLPEPVNNGQNNSCQNKVANEFIAESFVDLMFLRLPSPGSRTGFPEKSVWREEWLRGGNDFWTDVAANRNGKLGMPVETKSQYLQLLEETLSIASNIKTWAIAHVENGFVSTQDIVAAISKIRRVE
ncbi:MAG: hypothetical protein ACT4O9_16060, partial [Blastocatellia bacterium]